MLRKKYRIIGSFIGAAPGDVRQVNVSGLPLLLIPEEVALLRSLDDLKVILVESSPVKIVPNDAVQKLHRDFMLKSGAEYAKVNFVHFFAVINFTVKTGFAILEISRGQETKSP